MNATLMTLSAERSFTEQVFNQSADTDKYGNDYGCCTISKSTSSLFKSILKYIHFAGLYKYPGKQLVSL